MNWDDYRIFLAVAEAGTLSGAARRLEVTQPTVGRRIDALEQRLQVRLFDRFSHGYALTSAGERIRGFAERMEHEALRLERRVSGDESRIDGRVRIATAEGLGAFWLAGKMPALRKRHPNLELELAVGVSLADLLRREADVALRVGTPGSEELVGRRIGRVTFALYASKRYLRRAGTPSSVTDLNNHAIIESTGGTRNLVQARRLRELAPNASVGIRCDNFITQMMAARAGLGLLALPVYMATHANELVRLLPDRFEVNLDLWLLTHRDLRKTARVRAVLDYLAEAVEVDLI